MEREAALVPVESQEGATLGFAFVVLDFWRPAAGGVTALGSLDFDDACSLVGQHHRAVRTGHLDFKGQHANSVERFCRTDHARQSTDGYHQATAAAPATRTSPWGNAASSPPARGTSRSGS